MGIACGEPRNCHHLSKVSTRNFHKEFANQTMEEKVRCRICARVRGDRILSTCVVCGCTHCNNHDYEPSHARRHFNQNPNHCMIVAADKLIFCFKCDGYVKFESLSDTGREIFNKILEIYFKPQERHTYRVDDKKDVEIGQGERLSIIPIHSYSKPVGQSQFSLSPENSVVEMRHRHRDIPNPEKRRMAPPTKEELGDLEFAERMGYDSLLPPGSQPQRPALVCTSTLETADMTEPQKLASTHSFSLSYYIKGLAPRNKPQRVYIQQAEGNVVIVHEMLEESGRVGIRVLRRGSAPVKRPLEIDSIKQFEYRQTYNPTWKDMVCGPAQREGHIRLIENEAVEKTPHFIERAPSHVPSLTGQTPIRLLEPRLPQGPERQSTLPKADRPNIDSRTVSQIRASIAQIQYPNITSKDIIDKFVNHDEDKKVQRPEILRGKSNLRKITDKEEKKTETISEQIIGGDSERREKSKRRILRNCLSMESLGGVRRMKNNFVDKEVSQAYQEMLEKNSLGLKGDEKNIHNFKEYIDQQYFAREEAKISSSGAQYPKEDKFLTYPPQLSESIFGPTASEHLQNAQTQLNKAKSNKYPTEGEYRTDRTDRSALPISQIPKDSDIITESKSTHQAALSSFPLSETPEKSMQEIRTNLLQQTQADSDPSKLGKIPAKAGNLRYTGKRGSFGKVDTTNCQSSEMPSTSLAATDSKEISKKYLPGKYVPSYIKRSHECKKTSKALDQREEQVVAQQKNIEPQKEGQTTHVDPSYQGISQPIKTEAGNSTHIQSVIEHSIPSKVNPTTQANPPPESSISEVHKHGPIQTKEDVFTSPPVKSEELQYQQHTDKTISNLQNPSLSLAQESIIQQTSRISPLKTPQSEKHPIHKEQKDLSRNKLTLKTKAVHSQSFKLQKQEIGNFTSNIEEEEKDKHNKIIFATEFKNLNTQSKPYKEDVDISVLRKKQEKEFKDFAKRKTRMVPINSVEKALNQTKKFKGKSSINFPIYLLGENEIEKIIQYPISNTKQIEKSIIDHPKRREEEKGKMHGKTIKQRSIMTKYQSDNPYPNPIHNQRYRNEINKIGDTQKMLGPRTEILSKKSKRINSTVKLDSSPQIGCESDNSKTYYLTPKLCKSKLEDNFESLRQPSYPHSSKKMTPYISIIQPYNTAERSNPLLSDYSESPLVIQEAQRLRKEQTKDIKTSITKLNPGSKKIQDVTQPIDVTKTIGVPSTEEAKTSNEVLASTPREKSGDQLKKETYKRSYRRTNKNEESSKSYKEQPKESSQVQEKSAEKPNQAASKESIRKPRKLRYQRYFTESQTRRDEGFDEQSIEDAKATEKSLKNIVGDSRKETNEDFDNKLKTTSDIQARTDSKTRNFDRTTKEIKKESNETSMKESLTQADTDIKFIPHSFNKEAKYQKDSNQEQQDLLREPPFVVEKALPDIAASEDSHKIQSPVVMPENKEFKQNKSHKMMIPPEKAEEASPQESISEKNTDHIIFQKQHENPSSVSEELSKRIDPISQTQLRESKKTKLSEFDKAQSSSPKKDLENIHDTFENLNQEIDSKKANTTTPEIVRAGSKPSLKKNEPTKVSETIRSNIISQKIRSGPEATLDVHPEKSAESEENKLLEEKKDDSKNIIQSKSNNQVDKSSEEKKDKAYYDISKNTLSSNKNEISDKNIQETDLHKDKIISAIPSATLNQPETDIVGKITVVKSEEKKESKETKITTKNNISDQISGTAASDPQFTDRLSTSKEKQILIAKDSCSKVIPNSQISNPEKDEQPQTKSPSEEFERSKEIIPSESKSENKLLLTSDKNIEGPLLEQINSSRNFDTENTHKNNPNILPLDRGNEISSDHSTEMLLGHPTEMPLVHTNEIPLCHGNEIPSDHSNEMHLDHNNEMPLDHSKKMPSAHNNEMPLDHSKKMPSAHHTGIPSNHPTEIPSDQPTKFPSDQLTGIPSYHPTKIPSDNLTGKPSYHSTKIPSNHPTGIPSSHPIGILSDHSIEMPLDNSNKIPSDNSNGMPSDHPTEILSDNLTGIPSSHPIEILSDHRNEMPLDNSNKMPSDNSTKIPSDHPTEIPSDHPTKHIHGSSPTFNTSPSNITSTEPTKNTKFSDPSPTTFQQTKPLNSPYAEIKKETNAIENKEDIIEEESKKEPKLIPITQSSPVAKDKRDDNKSDIHQKSGDEKVEIKKPFIKANEISKSESYIPRVSDKVENPTIDHPIKNAHLNNEKYSSNLPVEDEDNKKGENDDLIESPEITSSPIEKSSDKFSHKKGKPSEKVSTENKDQNILDKDLNTEHQNEISKDSSLLGKNELIPDMKVHPQIREESKHKRSNKEIEVNQIMDSSSKSLTPTSVHSKESSGKIEASVPRYPPQSIIEKSTENEEIEKKMPSDELSRSENRIVSPFNEVELQQSSSPSIQRDTTLKYSSEGASTFPKPSKREDQDELLTDSRNVVPEKKELLTGSRNRKPETKVDQSELFAISEKEIFEKDKDKNELPTHSRNVVPEKKEDQKELLTGTRNRKPETKEDQSELFAISEKEIFEKDKDKNELPTDSRNVVPEKKEEQYELLTASKKIMDGKKGDSNELITGSRNMIPERKEDQKEICTASEKKISEKKEDENETFAASEKKILKKDNESNELPTDSRNIILVREKDQNELLTDSEKKMPERKEDQHELHSTSEKIISENRDDKNELHSISEKIIPEKKEDSETEFGSLLSGASETPKEMQNKPIVTSQPDEKRNKTQDTKSITTSAPFPYNDVTENKEIREATGIIPKTEPSNIPSHKNEIQKPQITSIGDSSSISPKITASASPSIIEQVKRDSSEDSEKKKCSDPSATHSAKKSPVSSNQPSPIFDQPINTYSNSFEKSKEDSSKLDTNIAEQLINIDETHAKNNDPIAILSKSSPSTGIIKSPLPQKQNTDPEQQQRFNSEQKQRFEQIPSSDSEKKTVKRIHYTKPKFEENKLTEKEKQENVITSHKKYEKKAIQKPVEEQEIMEYNDINVILQQPQENDKIISQRSEEEKVGKKLGKSNNLITKLERPNRRIIHDNSNIQTQIPENNELPDIHDSVFDEKGNQERDRKSDLRGIEEEKLHHVIDSKSGNESMSEIPKEEKHLSKKLGEIHLNISESEKLSTNSPQDSHQNIEETRSVLNDHIEETRSVLNDQIEETKDLSDYTINPSLTKEGTIDSPQKYKKGNKQILELSGPVTSFSTEVLEHPTSKMGHSKSKMKQQKEEDNEINSQIIFSSDYFNTDRGMVDKEIILLEKSSLTEKEILDKELIFTGRSFDKPLVHPRDQEDRLSQKPEVVKTQTHPSSESMLKSQNISQDETNIFERSPTDRRQFYIDEDIKSQDDESKGKTTLNKTARPGKQLKKTEDQKEVISDRDPPRKSIPEISERLPSSEITESISDSSTALHKRNCHMNPDNEDIFYDTNKITVNSPSSEIQMSKDNSHKLKHIPQEKGTEPGISIEKKILSKDPTLPKDTLESIKSDADQERIGTDSQISKSVSEGRTPLSKEDNKDKIFSEASRKPIPDNEVFIYNPENQKDLSHSEVVDTENQKELPHSEGVDTTRKNIISKSEVPISKNATQSIKSIDEDERKSSEQEYIPRSEAESTENKTIKKVSYQKHTSQDSNIEEEIRGKDNPEFKDESQRIKLVLQNEDILSDPKTSKNSLNIEKGKLKDDNQSMKQALERGEISSSPKDNPIDTKKLVTGEDSRSMKQALNKEEAASKEIISEYSPESEIPEEKDISQTAEALYKDSIPSDSDIAKEMPSNENSESKKYYQARNPDAHQQVTLPDSGIKKHSPNSEQSKYHIHKKNQYSPKEVTLPDSEIAQHSLDSEESKDYSRTKNSDPNKEVNSPHSEIERYPQDTEKVESGDTGKLIQQIPQKELIAIDSITPKISEDRKISECKDSSHTPNSVIHDAVIHPDIENESYSSESEKIKSREFSQTNNPDIQNERISHESGIEKYPEDKELVESKDHSHLIKQIPQKEKPNSEFKKHSSDGEKPESENSSQTQIQDLHEELISPDSGIKNSLTGKEGIELGEKTSTHIIPPKEAISSDSGILYNPEESKDSIHTVNPHKEIISSNREIAKDVVVVSGIPYLKDHSKTTNQSPHQKSVPFDSKHPGESEIAEYKDHLHTTHRDLDKEGISSNTEIAQNPELSDKLEHDDFTHTANLPGATITDYPKDREISETGDNLKPKQLHEDRIYSGTRGQKDPGDKKKLESKVHSQVQSQKDPISAGIEQYSQDIEKPEEKDFNKTTKQDPQEMLPEFGIEKYSKSETPESKDYSQTTNKLSHEKIFTCGPESKQTLEIIEKSEDPPKQGNQDPHKEGTCSTSEIAKDSVVNEESEFKGHSQDSSRDLSKEGISPISGIKKDISESEVPESKDHSQKMNRDLQKEGISSTSAIQKNPILSEKQEIKDHTQDSSRDLPKEGIISNFEITKDLAGSGMAESKKHSPKIYQDRHQEELLSGIENDPVASGKSEFNDYSQIIDRDLHKEGISSNSGITKDPVLGKKREDHLQTTYQDLQKEGISFDSEIMEPSEKSEILKSKDHSQIANQDLLKKGISSNSGNTKDPVVSKKPEDYLQTTYQDLQKEEISFDSEIAEPSEKSEILKSKDHSQTTNQDIHREGTPSNTGITKDPVLGKKPEDHSQTTNQELKKERISSTSEILKDSAEKEDSESHIQTTTQVPINKITSRDSKYSEESKIQELTIDLQKKEQITPTKEKNKDTMNQLSDKELPNLDSKKEMQHDEKVLSDSKIEKIISERDLSKNISQPIKLNTNQEKGMCEMKIEASNPESKVPSTKDELKKEPQQEDEILSDTQDREYPGDKEISTFKDKLQSTKQFSQKEATPFDPSIISENENIPESKDSVQQLSHIYQKDVVSKDQDYPANKEEEKNTSKIEKDKFLSNEIMLDNPEDNEMSKFEEKSQPVRQSISKEKTFSDANLLEHTPDNEIPELKHNSQTRNQIPEKEMALSDPKIGENISAREKTLIKNNPDDKKPFQHQSDYSSDSKIVCSSSDSKIDISAEKPDLTQRIQHNEECKERQISDLEKSLTEIQPTRLISPNIDLSPDSKNEESVRENEKLLSTEISQPPMHIPNKEEMLSDSPNKTPSPLTGDNLEPNKEISHEDEPLSHSKMSDSETTLGKDSFTKHIKSKEAKLSDKDKEWQKHNEEYQFKEDPEYTRRISSKEGEISDSKETTQIPNDEASIIQKDNLKLIKQTLDKERPGTSGDVGRKLPEDSSKSLKQASEEEKITSNEKPQLSKDLSIWKNSQEEQKLSTPIVESHIPMIGIKDNSNKEVDPIKIESHDTTSEFKDYQKQIQPAATMKSNDPTSGMKGNPFEENISSPSRIEPQNPSSEMKDYLPKTHLVDPEKTESYVLTSEMKDNLAEQQVGAPKIVAPHTPVTEKRNTSVIVDPAKAQSHDPTSEMKDNLVEENALSPIEVKSDNLNLETKTDKEQHLDSTRMKSHDPINKMKHKVYEEDISSPTRIESSVPNAEMIGDLQNSTDPTIAELHDPRSETKEKSSKEDISSPTRIESSVSNTKIKDNTHEEPHSAIEESQNPTSEMKDKSPEEHKFSPTRIESPNPNTENKNTTHEEHNIDFERVESHEFTSEMKEKSSEEHMPSPLLMDSNNPSTEMKDNLSNEYILSPPGIESNKPSAKIQDNSSEKHISCPAIKKSSDPEREAKEILSRKHILSPPIDQSHDHPEKIMGNISPEKHILSHPITESAVPKGEEKSQKEYVVASDHSIIDTKNISPDQHIYSPPIMDSKNPSTEMKDNLSNEYTLSPPGIEPHKPSSEIQDNSSEKHISSPVIAESKDLLTNSKNNSHENNLVSSPIIRPHDSNEEMKGNLHENISPAIKEAHNLMGENNSTEKHNLSHPITESDAFKKEMKVNSQEEHVSIDESHTSITTKNKTDLQQLHVASFPIDETHHPGIEGKDNSESKTQVYPNPEMSISDTLPKEISQPEQKEKPHYQIEADTEIKANTPESKISVPKDNFESTKPLPQKGKTEAYGKIENEEGKQFLENMESNDEEDKLMGSSESGDQRLVNPKLETTKSKDATDLSKELIKPGIDGKPIFSLLSRPSNENVVIHTPAFAQHNSSEDLVEQALYHPESGSGSPRNIEEDKTQLSSHKPSPIDDPKMKQNLIKESSKSNATNKDKTVIDPNPTNVSDKEIPATESSDKTLSKSIPKRDEVSDPTTQIVPERGANETTLANPKTAPKKIDTPISDQIPTSSIPREEFSGISAITQKDIGSSENLPVYLPIPPQDPSSFFDPNQFASTISPIMNPHTGQIGDNSGQISETERDLFELNEKIKSRRGKIDSSNKPTGKSTSSKESKMTSKEEKKKATKNSKLTQKGYSQTNPTTSGPTYAHRGPQPFDDSGSEIIDMEGQVIESETEFQNNPIPSFGREQVKQADPGLEEYIKTSQPQSSKKSKISPSHNVDTSVLGMESIEDLAREIANNMDRNSESLESKSKMSKPQSSDSSIEKGFGIIMDPSQLISPNYEENFGDDALKRPQYRTSNPELKQSSLPLTPIEERIESSPYFQSSNKKILDDEMEMGSPEPVRESHYASQALKSIQEKEREMKIRKAQQANRIGGSMGNSPGHLPFEIQSKFGQSKRAGNIPIEEPFSLYQIGSGSLRHRHTNTVGFSDAPRPIFPEVEFSRISKRDSNIDLTVTDFFDTTKRNVPARPSHFRKQSVGSMPARMPPAIRSRSSVQVNLEGRSRIYIGEEITKKKPIVIVPELQSSKDMAELGRALDSAISLSKKKAKEIKKNKPSRFSRKPAKVEPQALKTGKSSRPTPIKKPIKKPEPLSKSTAKNPKNSQEMSQTSRTPVKTTPRTKKGDSLQLSPMEELKETPKSLKKGKQLAQRPPRDISSSQAKCEKSGFFKNSLCGQSAGMGGDSFNADFMQELGWAHSGTKQVLRSDSMKQGEEEIKSYPFLVAQTEEPKQEDSLEEQPEEYSPESSRIIPSDNLHLLKEAQKAIEKHTYDSPDASTFRLTRRLGSPRFDSMTFEPLQQSMEQFGEPPANQTVSRSVARPKMANRTVLDPKAGLSGYSDTKSAKSWEKHVRGMKNHGNTNHLNAILQCLFALPCLVQGYLSPLHESWTSTKYNRCLRTFFQGYRKGFGPYDPLPFITSALINKNEEYNVFRVHDPYDTLKRIFFNMLKAQKIVAIKKKNLSETTDISTAETYLGSLVTSIIQNKATCKVCGKQEHTVSETQSFSIPSYNSRAFKQIAELDIGTKYSQEEVDGIMYYVPSNVHLTPRRDINNVFLSAFKQVKKVNEYCSTCDKAQDKLMESYIRVPPELIIMRLTRCESERTRATVYVNEHLTIDDVLLLKSEGIYSPELKELIEKSTPKDPPPCLCNYRLCAVIPVKEREETFYECYVRHSDKWFWNKDSSVRKTSDKEMKSRNPYILFYERMASEVSTSS